MISFICFSALAAQSPPAQLSNLRPVPFTEVTINDKFWSPRREVNRKVSLPHSLDMLERAGNIKDFELAASGAHSGYIGPVFMDSDLYKTLEAVSYSLATDPDAALSARIDLIIGKMAAAQMADGYLDTHYQVNEPTRRFTNLRDNHELYCAGHLFEAAAAHFRATGKRNLLDIATKYADLLVRTFGDGPGQRMGYSGHPEVELALVKLADVTGNQSYFELASFFIHNRGKHFFATEHNTPEARYDGTYWIDDVPITDHRNIKGHAVRAAYLMSGTTDVAARTHDGALLKMLNRVWRNTTEKNMYVTGGIGPSASNEGFTTDFDLPNLTAYQETCASVALAQWNYRMGLAYGDAKYADYVERSLFNGILSGVSCDGTKFFYVNPLESHGTHHRSEWFGCACCPPNVARTLASLGGYAYATDDSSLYVNQYIAGSVKTKVGTTPLAMTVSTNYPWDGAVTFRPSATERPIALRLRVPHWCKTYTLSASFGKIERHVQNEYLVISHSWTGAETVTLNLDMPVARVAANPNVKDDQGRFAVQRGPLIYCLEKADQSSDPTQLTVPLAAIWKSKFEPNLLGGVTTLSTEGFVAPETEWNNRLYDLAAAPQSVPVRAIPYCFWDNRSAGPMEVWLPVSPTAKPPRGTESGAAVSLSYVSDNCQPSAINDGKEPISSANNPGELCHWWPHSGTSEWVQYTWKRPQNVAGVRVYWFNDSKHGGGCNLPAHWSLEYLDGKSWKPVTNLTGFGIVEDKWNQTNFQPVTTTALRLSVQLQKGWAAGLHEWKVLPVED